MPEYELDEDDDQDDNDESLDVFCFVGVPSAPSDQFWLLLLLDG